MGKEAKKAAEKKISKPVVSKDKKPVSKQSKGNVVKVPVAKKAKAQSLTENDDDGGDDDDDDASEDDEDDGNSGDNDNDDEDDDENDDDDINDNPKTKKAKDVKGNKSNGKSKAKSKLKTKSSKSSNSASAPASGERLLKLKRLSKLERLEEARKAFKWWEAPDLPEGINWHYLEHPGMVFAPSYIPHNVPIRYDGELLILTPEQEEMATFYASIPEDGPQLGNAETRPVFQKNFFDEFQTFFPDGKVKKFEKCDFTLIRQHLDLQKNLRKAATQEEKELKKAEKDKVQLKYAYALVDGRLEKVGNYNMEPPGLFRGRGVHPKTGSLKRRAYPESVSINLSATAAVPVCSMPGHAWGLVKHDPAVTWLCNWTENVQNQSKYVQLAASSTFKGKSDQDKYGTAIQLRGCIDEVRKNYIDNLDSTDVAKQQIATAMWVIDRLALRVGGEKGEAEADTVGCCSLRREHLKFTADIDSTAQSNVYEIELEFLGKDSMLYKQLIDFNTYGPVGIRVYGCLKSFCRGKGPKDDVFETLNPTILNKHLSSILPGLSAKVFRTYNASVTLETELPTTESMAGMSVQEKVAMYNAANRQVAILCNHQKTVSKAAETMFEALNEKLTVLNRQKKELTEWLKLVKSGKKIPLKEDDKSAVEELQERLTSAMKSKESAKTTEEKLAATLALDAAKAAVKKDQCRRFEEKHMFKSQPSAESLQSRVETWTKDIAKLEVDIRNRDDNKEVSLGTSKINYMDPRISVAWCKRCEVPIDKIFARTLRDKFNWAMAVDPDWKFE